MLLVIASLCCSGADAAAIEETTTFHGATPQEALKTQNVGMADEK